MPQVNDLDTRIATLVFGKITKIYTTQDFPTRNALIKLRPAEQIAIVCERYKFWILNFAEALAPEENSGYAVLALLNSYFDMIAQLNGITGKPSYRVKEGIKKVFPELKRRKAVVGELEDRLRNPMAHMGLTKETVILIDLYDDPLVWGKYKGISAIVINPRLWANRIAEHFEQFAQQLHDPDRKYNSLRKKFLARIAISP